MRRWPLLVCVALLVVLTAAPAGAQEADEERAVDVSFDIGDFDAERGDWPITVVYVSGDLDEGKPFTVYLGDDDAELWSATETFEGPITAVTVAPFVAVGDVTRTAVAQDLPVAVDVGVVEPPPESPAPESPEVLEEVVVVETPTPGPQSPPLIPSPVGPVAEVLGQGAGGGGGGVLALSMVLAVILVAIVFRTPLPSQSTQRWTK